MEVVSDSSGADHAGVRVSAAGSRPDGEAATARRAPGFREPFQKLLTAVRWALLAALSPTLVATNVIQSACQVPAEHLDEDVLGWMLGGAVAAGVRGCLLSSGFYSAAYLSECLCSTMLSILKESHLPLVAGGVVHVHAAADAAQKAAAAAAAGCGATGVNHILAEFEAPAGASSKPGPLSTPPSIAVILLRPSTTAPRPPAPASSGSLSSRLPQEVADVHGTPLLSVQGVGRGGGGVMRYGGG